MKKQKRDTTNRAFQRGYQNGLAGKSKDQCPYDQGDIRSHWISGWREGRTDQWDGLTGVAGVHRIAAVRQHI
jgi:ribosome modulation factor